MVDLRFASAQRVAPAAQRAEVPVQWMGAHGRTGEYRHGRSGPSARRRRPGPLPRLVRRDSLIFALQVRQRRPDISAATQRALAARQDRTDDPEIDEQPGKILHEWRTGAPDRLVAADWPVRAGALHYYGTSDASLHTTGWDGGATTSPSGGPRSATSTTSHS
jgi:hypothetical protein